MIEKRAPTFDDVQRWGPGDHLAIIYTFGYLAMVGAVIWFPIPDANSQMLNTLVTIMSTIQIGIGKCYYDRNRADIAAQKVAAVEQAKSSAVVQEIAKTAAPTAALAVAALRAEPAPPAPVTPPAPQPAPEPAGETPTKEAT